MTTKATKRLRNFYAAELDPLTMHSLVNALENLMAAREKTEHGFVSDFCDNAIKEIKSALNLYTGTR